MNPAVIKTLLATAGITDPALVAFIADLVSNSENVKHEPAAISEVAHAIAESKTCLKISGTVKGKPMLAFLVLTK